MPGFEREYYNQAELWRNELLDIPEERERIRKTIDLIPYDVKTILDAGYGNGAFLNTISNAYEVVGLDSSEEALKYVKTTAILGDISRMPFEAENFDLVTCLEVLEHLPLDTYKRALAELQRVSRKYIIISVPNCEDLDFQLVICPSCRCWYNPNRHLRSFDMAKMKTLFEHFSLDKIEEIGPLDSLPRYNRYLFTAYRLWRSSLPPNTAVCPMCGYKVESDRKYDTTTFSNGPKNYIIKPIKLFARLVWRPYYKRRWLLARYQRQT